MKLLFWKNNEEIDGFAIVIANDLYSNVQPEEARAFVQGRLKDERKARRRVEQRIEAVVFEMRQFIREQSLGLYGKARLQKAFNNRLLELGYDSAVTRKLLEIIMLRALTHKSDSSSGE